MAQDLAGGPFLPRLVTMLAQGSLIFDKIDFTLSVSDFLEALQHLPAPPILCSDMKWYVPGWGLEQFVPVDIEQWVDYCITTRQSFDEFFDACGE